MIKKILRLFSTIRCRLYSPENYARHLGATIGKNCVIKTRNWSCESYLVTIGNNCQIANGVTIHTHGGAQAARYLDSSFDVFGKVVIEDWAYIGAYSQIMPGVTIGEGAMVAAGSVVTKSVPPHTVVGGNPARYICTTEAFYERNKKYNTGTNGLSFHDKEKILRSLPDDRFIRKPFMTIPE